MTQLYLHGLGQTPGSWEKTIAHLKSAPHSLCPDLAGLVQGQDAAYQNLYKACSKACGGIDGKIDLCGLSLGGVLALNYAADYPQRVRSLVLIAPQYKMPKGLLRFQNMLFRFMPKAMFQQTGFGKAEFLRLCRSMMELDFTASLRNISCPTLVICGEKDAANLKAAVKLAGMMKNARLQIIKDSGHAVNEEAPEALAALLHDFFGPAG